MDNSNLGQRVDSQTWTEPANPGETARVLEITRVGNLVYPGLTVSVWTVVNPGLDCYSGRFIRRSDLPSDLQAAFGEWHFLAQVPFSGAAYSHDFHDFMCSGSGEFTAVVRKYL